MKTLTILLTLLSCLMASVINIPADYSTIQQGIDASTNGDTVLVQPGIYQENLIIENKSLVLLASEPNLETLIEGSEGSVISSNGFQYILSIEGFQIFGGGQANGISGSGVGELRVKNCIVYENNYGIHTHSHMISIIENSLFYGNNYGFINTYYGEESFITNCTFSENSVNEIFWAPLYSETNMYVTNSIITGNVEGGEVYEIVDGGIIFFEYSNLETILYESESLVFAGGVIHENSEFVNPSDNNFYLSPLSPCIDAGSPDLDGDGITWENDPDDQDPDGTRNDMGAYYFSQISGCTDPFAINYNPEATIDDGSCNYEGCTYFQAINYNSDASLDDGSCEFLFADVNFDTIVDILDIVIIVSMIMGD